ncbi:MAG: hypothetical protein FJZ59_05395 [Chlamydiae bacterium]|nr:hypothetical protein [Chlamydiota bacterium]
MEALSVTKVRDTYLETTEDQDISIEKFNELFFDLKENHTTLGFPVELRINQLLTLLKARYEKNLRANRLHERTLHLLIHHTIRIKKFCLDAKIPLPENFETFCRFLTSSKQSCKTFEWLPEQVIQKKALELCLLDPSEISHIAAILEEIREAVDIYYLSIHEFEEYEHCHLIESFQHFMCDELAAIYQHVKKRAVPDCIIDPPSESFAFDCEIDASFSTIFRQMRLVTKLSTNEAISYGLLTLFQFEEKHGGLFSIGDFEKPLAAAERILEEIPEKNRLEPRRLYFVIDLLNNYGNIFSKADLPLSDTFLRLSERTWSRLYSIKDLPCAAEQLIDSLLESIFVALPHPFEKKVAASIKDPRYHAYETGRRPSTVDEAIKLYLDEKKRGVCFDTPSIYDVIPPPPPFSRKKLEDVAYPYLVSINNAVLSIKKDLLSHTFFEQNLLLRKIRVIFTNRITLIICKWKRAPFTLSISEIQEYTKTELANTSPKSKATILALSILKDVFLRE